jgi:putative membrane protein
MHRRLALTAIASAVAIPSFVTVALAQQQQAGPTAAATGNTGAKMGEAEAKHAPTPSRPGPPPSPPAGWR